MTVVINGTTGITNPNSMTIGNGGGSVATNTAVGASALAGNSTGANATAVGNNALKLSTTDYNTAVGSNAAQATTTGAYNSAFGVNALFANTTGASNTALGMSALQSNTTASNNTAVGYQAMYSNVTGTENVAIGKGALYANTYSYSTALGFGAGAAHNANDTSGSTFVGSYSGSVATSGINNTFIGASSGSLVTTGGKNTILGGYNGNQGGLDIRTSNNYIVLSDGDGNPRGYWSTSGVFYQTGPELRVNPTTATEYALLSAANNGGTFYAGIDNSSGSVFGNGAYVRNIYSGGAYRIYVTANSAGVYLAPAGTSWTSASDERFKTDLTPIENGLDKVCTLRSVTGRYVTDEEGTSRSFLIAQDVQAVLPEAVDASDPEKLGVQYTDTIPLLVAAIKELNAKVEAQAAEIAALKGQA